MASQYYTLVAGLREFALDAENKGFDARTVIDEVRAELTAGDDRRVSLFYTYYDIGNVVNLLAGRTQFSALGNFTREELEQEIKEPTELPPYIGAILRAYAEPENPEYDEIDRVKSIEKALFGAYYDVCSRSGCRFIREWYGFDRNLRNVTAALTARRLGLPVADETVGDDYVAQTLARSSAADFGLRGELEYLDRVIAAAGEESDLLEKEHRIDLLRWDMADELTAFNYFDINTILAYLAKINILYRWSALDPAAGREVFRELLSRMSGERALEDAGNDK